MGIGGGQGGESFARPSGERLASNRHELAEAAHEGGLRTWVETTTAYGTYACSPMRGLKLPMMEGKMWWGWVLRGG